MKPHTCFLTCLSLLVLLGGCASSRSSLNITAPSSNTVAQQNGKEVFINSIRDKRVFEIAPSSPSTPSIDPNREGGDQIELRAIGRKRTQYGKALGDILLKDQTVETLMAATIRQAFIEKGYKVLDSKEQVTQNTYIVDGSIDTFWAWMFPKGVFLTIDTEIETALTIKSQKTSEKKLVSAKVSNNYPTIRDGNWVKTIKNALETYVDELKSKLP